VLSTSYGPSKASFNEGFATHQSVTTLFDGEYDYIFEFGQDFFQRHNFYPDEDTLFSFGLAWLCFWHGRIMPDFYGCPGEYQNI
jgi:hypothetical protein